MRISTNMIYQTGIARIGDLTAAQARLQEQITTGRKMLTPADDPVGATKALALRQAASVNAQYAENRQAAMYSLGVEEAALNGVTDLLLAVKSTIVSAGNASYSDTERGFLATDLRAALEQLLNLANTRDGTGNYIFSGYQSQAPAFVESAGGVSYQGDMNQQQLQVSASRRMNVADNGAGIFQAAGNDLFQTINDIASLLETPVIDATDADALIAGLSATMDSIDAGLDTVLTVRAAVGTRLNELEALETFGQELDAQYEQSLSAVEDLDYAQALSDISRQQIILEAAQKSFVMISGLSLFDYF